ncbi:MotA/TolQ/ExbB proton channel family protein [Bacteroides caecimuris]|uniref:MotA/TolQ/ExbB proton channel family protein n=2 Tax=Bacteroidales TaxID=171549 RepID=UPI00263BC27A|nr:MotA/TolQ/ExbB proton channel family protein [Bacteroides caecimuris]
MTTISDILFIISNGILIPVIVLLLFLLVKAIVLVIGFYTEWQKNRQLSAQLQHLVENFNAGTINDLDSTLVSSDNSPIVKCLRDMLSHKDDSIYCEHSLADFQVDVQQQLSKNRVLIKFGPMLGLMGTLIPMGPALVGLATGDIASMAYNMQVAFATTVVGMLVAGIGLATLQVRQRFYARSLNTLDFLYHKLTGK